VPTSPQPPRRRNCWVPPIRCMPCRASLDRVGVPVPSPGHHLLDAFDRRRVGSGRRPPPSPRAAKVESTRIALIFDSRSSTPSSTRATARPAARLDGRPHRSPLAVGVGLDHPHMLPARPGAGAPRCLCRIGESLCHAGRVRPQPPLLPVLLPEILTIDRGSSPGHCCGEPARYQRREVPRTSPRCCRARPPAMTGRECRQGASTPRARARR